MAKTTTLRGTVILKENTRTESLTDRILAISSAGVITDRPAISASGFVSSTLPSAQIIVGNGSNVATAVAMSGVIAISNAGVTSIVDGSIVNADVNASAAIAYSKLSLTGGIVNADVNASAAIAYSKLNLATSIVNADVAVAAAIARSKTAAGTAYRILANNASGVMSENAALTAGRAVGSDVNGQLQVSTTTFTQLGYSDTLTGNIQTQLNTKITGKATNALVQAPTAAEDGFAITWDDGAQEWSLTDPVVQGIPVAGSARQFLGKNSGTNYDASWLTLLITDIPAVTASAAELNILDGATLTVTELNYVDGVTSAIQTQLDAKQSSSLAQDAMWIGNGSGIATQLSPGTSGYVLTSVGGTPQWQPSAAGGVSGLTTNRIPYATSSSTLGDDAALTWDATNNALTVSNGFSGAARIFTRENTSFLAGTGAGNFTFTGAANTGVGYNSLASMTDGVGNTSFGASSLASVTGGDGNTAIGNSALTLVTGDNNIGVGEGAGANITTGSRNVVIGADISAQSVSADGQLSIQNAIFGQSNTATGTTVSSGVIGLYSAAAIGSWQKATFIGNIGVESTAIANGIVLYAKDSSDGSANSTLALYTEQAPEATGTFTQTHRLKVWINGTEYWLSLDAV